MRSSVISNVVLAFLFALLLPLQQLQCACSGPSHPVTGISAPSKSAHACCAAAEHSAGSHRASPSPCPQHHASHVCACAGLNAVVAPDAVLSAAAGASFSGASAAAAIVGLLAPDLVRTGSALELETGSPPLPSAPRAHGLRAPPHSA